MSVILEMHDLLVRLDRKIVLDIDHLTLEKGEVLSVVGPNGSGKTSLLLTVARLLKPERGQIHLSDCHQGGETDTQYRRRLGLVMQEPLLLDTSVFINVAIGLRFRHLPGKEIQTRTDTWLKRLGIETLRQRPASKLSGGEAQRVSLARTFALQPELLLLDEPFNGLDAPSRCSLLADLKSILHETGTSTIFITHDLQEAVSLGDKMAVLLNGRLHQHGTPDAIYSNPINEAVRLFLGQPAGGF